MQCLSSPTRNEIDKAHSQGIWLDIGVPSVRNLRKLSTTRIILWWLLAISSIPLHLLYNSAVFSTLSAQRFSAYLVTREFLDGAPFSPSLAESSNVDMATLVHLQDDSQDHLQDALRDILQVYKTNHSFVRLEVEECVDTYSTPIISTNSDLILVSDYQNSKNSLIWYDQEVYSPLFYYGNTVFCFLEICDRPGVVNNPRNLSIGLFNQTDPNIIVVEPANTTRTVLSSFDYCLSKRVREHCKLQFSLTIILVVIVCNMIKTVCMAMISWKQDPEPLVTLGDAIASFLDRPDVTTKRNCIAGRTRFEDANYRGILVSRWHTQHLRWFRAASRKRWIVCNVL